MMTVMLYVNVKMLLLDTTDVKKGILTGSEV